MSVAASVHELEGHAPELEGPTRPEAELVAVQKLTEFPPAAPLTGPIIAIDLDDVLSQTNLSVAEWHNEVYGTDMKVSDFFYYYYWKNPYWGSPRETHLKVREFYRTDRIHNTKPVLGAREGVESLKQLGFRLVVVTARSEDAQDESWKWLDRNFPGTFETIICTGQFQDAHKKGHEVVTKLSKADVCNDLKAVLLIDDSAENAVSCVSAVKPVPTLLFGDYEWNKRMCTPADANDDTTYDIRLEREGDGFWKKETVPVPEGAPLWRVRDWSEAVRWIKARKEEGSYD